MFGRIRIALVASLLAPSAWAANSYENYQAPGTGYGIRQTDDPGHAGGGVPNNIICDQGGSATLCAGVTAAGVTALNIQGVTGGVPVPVTGTFWQATQPISAASLPLPAGAAQESGNLATLAGGVAAGLYQENLSQVSGVALGAMANYGTSPGAVKVLGANVFVTNTPNVVDTVLEGGVSGGLFQQNLSQYGGVAVGAMANYGTSPGAVKVPGANVFVTNTPNVVDTVLEGGVSSGIYQQNLSQYGGVALGAMANYGTSPGAVKVPGANVFVTNTPATNITQWAGNTLGATSNYGTSPGAVAVMGVNAFITNTPAVTCAACALETGKIHP